MTLTIVYAYMSGALTIMVAYQWAMLAKAKREYRALGDRFDSVSSSLRSYQGLASRLNVELTIRNSEALRGKK